ncbi:MAG: 30S ribosomal protein S4 [Candidatus Eremiobacteraeota bacterium]|nr:30S ribosomal protein S4 [Candidatus Eremiobacteraeota bacterium]MBV8204282.1 30S ribosomal protein S4 [Candidatus Eremiobacteraeota bacterium]MBV8339315.1 30S ribosomal protein S4 [Candidatus Eremiobacteraeota bacterium]MBV8459463.1 30S ribosomal protein S4 [Candidatus Eremiobacteraeota bacterium]MBV8596215.1 30S ribosomal protein S4 [Candidatus Eremiobacteraeota bacterium]
MARYTGPVCRMCRRESASGAKPGEKVKLFLKGERCLSKKCAVERRTAAPGQKANTKNRPKVSEFGRQLREKQKMRRIYGVLEKQFENYFVKASATKGQTGAALLALLETRLDNVIYRLNLATSRAQARQLVRHRHFTLNGRRVNVPSMQVKPGDEIAIVETSVKTTLFGALTEYAKGRRVPGWLEFDEQKNIAKVVQMPTRADIDTNVEEQLIVEYYSR